MLGILPFGLVDWSTFSSTGEYIRQSLIYMMNTSFWSQEEQGSLPSQTPLRACFQFVGLCVPAQEGRQRTMNRRTANRIEQSSTRQCRSLSLQGSHSKANGWDGWSSIKVFLCCALPPELHFANTDGVMTFPIKRLDGKSTHTNVCFRWHPPTGRASMRRRYLVTALWAGSDIPSDLAAQRSRFLRRDASASAARLTPIHQLNFMRLTAGV